MKKSDSKKRIVSLFFCAFFLVCATSATAATEAVLIRGNRWVNGIAGFGANGFPALSGEYRLQARAAANAASRGGHGAEADFSVHVTREALHFSGEWQPRGGTGNIPVLQRTGEEGFLAALVIADRRGASWNAIFRFKDGLEGAGISGDDFNRLLQVWSGRFSFFLYLSTAPTDVSLPAALEF